MPDIHEWLRLVLLYHLPDVVSPQTTIFHNLQLFELVDHLLRHATLPHRFYMLSQISSEIS